MVYAYAVNIVLFHSKVISILINLFRELKIDVKKIEKETTSI